MRTEMVKKDKQFVVAGKQPHQGKLQVKGNCQNMYESKILNRKGNETRLSYLHRPKRKESTSQKQIDKVTKQFNSQENSLVEKCDSAKYGFKSNNTKTKSILAQRTRRSNANKTGKDCSPLKHLEKSRTMITEKHKVTQRHPKREVRRNISNLESLDESTRGTNHSVSEKTEIENSFEKRGEQLNKVKGKCIEALTIWNKKDDYVEKKENVVIQPRIGNHAGNYLKQEENQTFDFKQDSCKTVLTENLNTQYIKRGANYCDFVLEDFGEVTDITTHGICKRTQLNKNFKEDEFCELRDQERQVLAKLNERQAKQNKANFELEFEQCMCEECGKKAQKHEQHIAQDFETELLVSKRDIQHAFTKFGNIEADINEPKSEKDLEHYLIKDMERKLSVYENRIKKMEEQNDNELTSQRNIKAPLENMVERRDRDLREALSKLKGTEAKLEETITKMEFEMHERHRFEKAARYYKDNIERLKDENKKLTREQNQTVHRLKGEIKDRDVEKKATALLFVKKKQEIIDKNKRIRDLKESMDQTSELKKQLEHALIKLKRTNEELEHIKSEKKHEMYEIHKSERKINEFKNRIEYLETENNEHITSQKQKIQYFENEIENRDIRLESLEKMLANTKHDVTERDKQKKDFHDTEDKLSALRYEHRQTEVNLSKTEAKLVETMREKQLEQQIRQSLESKTNELENHMTCLKEICRQEILNHKHKIQLLQKEAEHKDHKIKGLEALSHSSKYDVSERNQVRQNLQETAKQLSETQVKLLEAVSEIELEKHNRQESERKVSEYENLMKQSKDENDEILNTNQRKINQLEKDIEEKYQEVKSLQESLSNERYHSVQNSTLREKLKKSEDTLYKLSKRLQEGSTKLKSTEERLQETICKREHELLERNEFEKSVSEYENRFSLLMKENVEKQTSLNQIIQTLKNEIECRDKHVKDIEQMFENTKHEQYEALVKCRETEAKLDAAIHENQCEKHTRTDLERKISTFKNLEKLLKEENKQEIASHQQRINNLETEIEQKDLKIKDLEASVENCRHESSEENQLKQNLQETIEHLSELKNLQEQTSAKLKETQAKLVETIAEKDFEMQERHDSEIKNTEYETRIKQSKVEIDQMFKSHQQAIRQLKKEIEGKDQEAKAFKESLDSGKQANVQRSKVKDDIKDYEERIYETKEQLQQALTKLRTTEGEMEVLEFERNKELLKRNEIESIASEYENRISHLEKDSLEKLTAHKEAIEDFKNEIEHRDKLVRELEELLEDTKHEQHEALTELRDTNGRLEISNHEKQFEQNARQDLESKIYEFDKRIKQLKEANKQEIVFYKQRIHNFETEVEQRNQEIKDLKASNENFKHKLDKTAEQLLGVRNQQQETLLELKETQAKLAETLSEKEFERRIMQELERKNSEYENHIKQSKDEINEMSKTHKQRIKQFERNIESKDREVNALQESFRNSKQVNIEKGKLKENLKVTEDQLTELKHQLNRALTNLKITENELKDTKSKAQNEQHERNETERKACEFETRLKHLEKELNEKMTSENQLILNCKNEVERRDQKLLMLEKLLENTKHELRDTKAELNKTEAKLEDTNHERQFEQQIRHELKKNNDELEDNIKHMKEANKQEITLFTQKLQCLKKEAEHKDHEVKELKAMIESYKYEVRDKNQLEKNLKETAEELSKIQDQRNRLLANLNETKAKLNELDRKLKTYENLLKQSKNEYDVMMKTHKQKITKLELEVKGKDREAKGLNDSENGELITKLEDQLKQALTKLKETEAELDETKTRLSKAMGDRLTDNNPNIADLSDMNRPIKLAERYAELYDNQWTDAYDILEKEYDREQDTIEALLQVLQDTMHFCEANANKQLDDLQAILGLSSTVETGKVPADVRKHLKDSRKKMAPVAIRNLYEVYIAHVKRSAPQTLKTVQDIRSYLTECLEICWLMAIQDPPVVFAPMAKSGSGLDTDVFKPYTSSGTHIEYIVWPALLLHDGGPVLAKGVAQGYGKKSRTAKQARQEKA